MMYRSVVVMVMLMVVVSGVVSAREWFIWLQRRSSIVIWRPETS